MMLTRFRGGRSLRVLLASALAGLVLVTVPSCGYLFGDSVEVDLQGDNSLNAAFQRVIDTRQPTRLGDVIAGAGLPVRTWDRMYAFHSVRDGEELNAALGVDVEWKGVSGGSGSTFVQVFMNKGEVVYALADWPPRYSVGDKRYGTPDSVVTPVQKEQVNPINHLPEVVWDVRIEDFGRDR